MSPAHLGDPHFPQGLPRPVVVGAVVGGAPEQAAHEAAAPIGRAVLDVLVAFLPQPGPVEAVGRQPEQPVDPRDRPDGFEQERGRSAVGGDGVGGEVFSRQGDQVRRGAAVEVRAGAPQPRARHGVVAGQFGVFDVDEQCRVRGHPAQRHRLQQSVIGRDRASAADVQHSAASRDERGQRDPVVLQEVVERVGALVALAVRDDERAAVQDPRHRLPVAARTGVAPTGGVPGGQREERRRGEEIGDAGTAQGPVTGDLGGGLGRGGRLPQPGAEDGLRAVDVRLLDVDGRLRAPALGHRTVDAQDLPDARQEEEEGDRAVRGAGLGQGERDPRGEWTRANPGVPPMKVVLPVPFPSL